MTRYHGHISRPLERDDQAVGKVCPICDRPLIPGEQTALTWTDGEHGPREHSQSAHARCAKAVAWRAV